MPIATLVIVFGSWLLLLALTLLHFFVWSRRSDRSERSERSERSAGPRDGGASS